MRADQLRLRRLVLLLAFTWTASACAVHPETNIRIVKTAADGSTIEASVERAWQGGPVSVRCEIDPATGRWAVEWRSDVDLGPAAEASRSQIDAQRRAFENGVRVAIEALKRAGGLP